MMGPTGGRDAAGQGSGPAANWRTWVLINAKVTRRPKSATLKRETPVSFAGPSTPMKGVRTQFQHLLGSADLPSVIG